MIVFRDGYLCNAPGARGRVKKNNSDNYKEEEGLDKDFEFWDHGVQIDFPKNLMRIGVNLSPWSVTIHRLSGRSDDPMINNLDQVDFFLDGFFSYEIEVPVESNDVHDVILVVLSDYKKTDSNIRNNGSKRSRGSETNDETIEVSSDFEIVPVRDLGPVDQRLKSGLPLLVPYVKTEKVACKHSNFFRLEYSHMNYVKKIPTKINENVKKTGASSASYESVKKTGTSSAFSSAVASSLSTKSPSPPKSSKHSPEVSFESQLKSSTPSSPSTPLMQLSTPLPSTPAVALTPASLPTIPLTIQTDRYHQLSSSKPSLLSVSFKSPRSHTPGSEGDDDTPPNSVFKQLNLDGPIEKRELGRRLELNEFANPNFASPQSPNESISSKSSSSSENSPRIARRRSKLDDFGSKISF